MAAGGGRNLKLRPVLVPARRWSFRSMAPKPKSASQQKSKASASADNGSKKAKSDAKGKGKAVPAPDSAAVTSSQDPAGTTSDAAAAVFRRNWSHTTLSESNASAHPAVYTPDAK